MILHVEIRESEESRCHNWVAVSRGLGVCPGD